MKLRIRCRPIYRRHTYTHTRNSCNESQNECTFVRTHKEMKTELLFICDKKTQTTYGCMQLNVVHLLYHRYHRLLFQGLRIFGPSSDPLLNGNVKRFRKHHWLLRLLLLLKSENYKMISAFSFSFSLFNIMIIYWLYYWPKWNLLQCHPNDTHIYESIYYIKSKVLSIREDQLN